MKLEIRSAFSTLVLLTSLFDASFAQANSARYLQSLFKRMSPARAGIASELSPQHKDITSRLMSQGLMRTVKVHHDFTPFLKLSDFMDPETAEKISGLVDFSINGYSIKKKDANANPYTLIPVRIGQPITIEVALNRGNATSLLEVAKSKATLPSWSDSSLMKLLDLVSFRITYKRPLDKENSDYYLSSLICEQEDLANLISEPTSDAFYSLAKKYGHPGWFDINIDLPEIQPIEL
ncbi:hypothetical protein BH09DEP1_BH09DEP1_7410 [soil metagenome]